MMKKALIGLAVALGVVAVSNVVHADPNAETSARLTVTTAYDDTLVTFTPLITFVPPEATTRRPDLVPPDRLLASL